tara:strand:+ start:3647 stop:4006 length:360 start_codon:yes stop_codon:yes gene_type:complete
MARPRKEIDQETFEKLCHLQCTQEEIMGFFDIDTKDTLNTRIREIYGENECFSTIYSKRKQGGRIAVRRKQMQVAESGNPTMLIWLGKQYLGQAEKTEQLTRTESVEEYLKRIATEENN